MIYRHYTVSFSIFNKKDFLLKIDKHKVVLLCCNRAAEGEEPPRKEAVRTRKSPYFGAPNTLILSRTNQVGAQAHAPPLRPLYRGRFYRSKNRNFSLKIMHPKVKRFWGAYHPVF